MSQNLPSIFGRRDRRGLTETAATGLGGLMPPHVSIKGNRFALVDAGGQRFPLQTMYLDCIVIDINPNVCKTYWGSSPYQDGDDQPPLCFSDNGVGPSAQATEPQARTCAECAQQGGPGAWNSAINEQTGKGRKACSDRRKAAVVVLNDPTGHCYQFQVPPASLKPFLKYSGQLQAMTAPGLDRRADMDDVVTRITFADNKNGELQFQAVAWINSVQLTTMGLELVTQQTAQGVQVALSPDGGAAVAGIIDGLLDRRTTETIVNKNDRPWSGALQIAQAAPQAQIAPPQSDRPVFDQTDYARQSQLADSAVDYAQQAKLAARATEYARQAQQRLAPDASTTPLPQSQPSGRGGARPGAGRRPKKVDQPAPRQEVISPGLPMPMQAQPQHQQPAIPEPLTGLQNHGPPPQPTTNLGNSAFAQPQSLASEMDEALNVAMNLETK